MFLLVLQIHPRRDYENGDENELEHKVTVSDVQCDNHSAQ